MQAMKLFAIHAKCSKPSQLRDNSVMDHAGERCPSWYRMVSTMDKLPALNSSRWQQWIVNHLDSTEFVIVLTRFTLVRDSDCLQIIIDKRTILYIKAHVGFGWITRCVQIVHKRYSRDIFELFTELVVLIQKCDVWKCLTHVQMEVTRAVVVWQVELLTHTGWWTRLYHGRGRGRGIVIRQCKFHQTQFFQIAWVAYSIHDKHTKMNFIGKCVFGCYNCIGTGV
jgi:hypothetical protein